MLKKTLIASLLAGVSLPLLAANSYYIVVPVPSRTAAAAAVSVTLNPAALPAGVEGTAYAGFDFNQALQVTGDGAYSGYGVRWTLASGALPPGLSLNANGTLTGTPTAPGTVSFSVRASYKTKSGEQAYQVVVGAITVNLNSVALPVGQVGAPFNFDFRPQLHVDGDAEFDPARVVWNLSSGTLPAGLVLSSAGVLSGVPAAATAFTGDSIQVSAAYKNKTARAGYALTLYDFVDSKFDITKLGGVDGSVTSPDSYRTVTFNSKLLSIPAMAPLPAVGKWYVEFTSIPGIPGEECGGIGIGTLPIPTHVGKHSLSTDNLTYPDSCGFFLYQDTVEMEWGTNAGGQAISGGPSGARKLGLAYDAATRTASFYRENVLVGTCSVNGTAPLYVLATNGSSGAGSSIRADFRPEHQTYAPPAGYIAGIPK